MTTAEMEQWAGEAERLYALATSGTVGAEMAAATLRLRGVECIGALIAAVAAERARCAAVCREVAARQSAHLGCGAAESARDEADARSNAALECAEAIERGAVER